MPQATHYRLAEINTESALNNALGDHPRSSFIWPTLAVAAIHALLAIVDAIEPTLVVQRNIEAQDPTLPFDEPETDTCAFCGDRLHFDDSICGRCGETVGI